MKLLSFAIPCYNSAAYMEKCIKSCLAGGDDVEIIIVDDGSTKDDTLKIAKEYEAKYPNIVKAVHQENGGHGQAVNTGLANATGMFFKVVDSDDWVDVKSYKKILTKLKSFVDEDDLPDMLIANYVYEKVGAKRKKVIHYENALPVDRMFGWDEMGHFKVDQYILMHSVIYRTQLIKEFGLKLPEHTFYVDNLFSYKPLPYAETIYYMDIDLYHYYLGRDDQSVNEKVLMKRIDQQILVTDLVTRSVDLAEVKKIHPKLEAYMVRNISIMLTISSIHLLLIDTADSYKKRKDMWNHVKEYNEALYYRLRFRTLSGFTYLPGKIGASLTIGGYRLAKKVYRFQ